MKMRTMMITAFAAATLAGAAGLYAQDEPESWIDSPEAYFATANERSEWETLSSKAARELFKDQYWLRRDPTPGTADNEFRTTVLERIKVADQRFPVDAFKGSRTDMGKVFIVLGSPARTSDNHVTPQPRPTNPSAASNIGALGTNRAWGWDEGNEINTKWIWERDRTPKVLDAIGRPSLEIAFVAEPSKRTVRIQNPGLFNEYRDKIAQASITNADMKQAAAMSAAAMLPVATLKAATDTAILRSVAEGTNRQAAGVTWNHAILLNGAGASPVVWVSLPAESVSNRTLVLVGTVSGADGVKRQFAQPFVEQKAFVASSPSRVGAVRLPLGEGTWNIDAGVADGNSVLASTQTTIRVPAVSQKWATSSLILTGGPEQSTTGGDFVLAGLQLNPRADKTFLSSESLWYFFEVSNPADPAATFVELRLRRDGQPHGKPAVFPASLQEIQPGVWLAGFEMPLAGLPEGNYSIYVGLKETAEAPQNAALLRADFKLIAR